MARVSYVPISASPSRQLLAHNSRLLAAFEVISQAVREQLTLPDDLREEVRKHLAYGVECRP